MKYYLNPSLKKFDPKAIGCFYDRFDCTPHFEIDIHSHSSMKILSNEKFLIWHCRVFIKYLFLNDFAFSFPLGTNGWNLLQNSIWIVFLHLKYFKVLFFCHSTNFKLLKNLFAKLSFWGYLLTNSNCTIFNCCCLLANRMRLEFLFFSNDFIIYLLKYLFLFEFSSLPLFSSFIIVKLSFHFWHLEGLLALLYFFISRKKQNQKLMIRRNFCYLKVFLLFPPFFQFIQLFNLYWTQSFNLY